mmetsp:Transcript_20625/g.57271  ORF Transcript_20625/g.57271 Transcript_20625/m.57271 type:complete len:106 (-) Transcript_20625:1871-2188(-)
MMHAVLQHASTSNLSYNMQYIIKIISEPCGSLLRTRLRKLLASYYPTMGVLDHHRNSKLMVDVPSLQSELNYSLNCLRLSGETPFLSDDDRARQKMDHHSTIGGV